MSQPQIHSLTLSEQLRYSRQTLEDFLNPEKNQKIWKEKDIPMSLFQDCRGIAILHMYKATFGIGGVMGTGIIIGRTIDGNWTAPISLSLNGAELGLAIGVSKSEHVLIFKDLLSLQIFMENGQIKLGTDVNVSLGTMGHEANMAVDFNKDGTKAAGIVSYSVSSTGVYLGVSLEGILITVNSELHEQFYGRPVNIKQIYTGEVNMPVNEDYKMMIDLVNKHIMPNEKVLSKDPLSNPTNMDSNNLNQNRIQENNISSTAEPNKTWDHLPQSKQYMWNKLKNEPHNNLKEQEVLPLNQTQPQYKDKELLNEQIEPENAGQVSDESQQVNSPPSQNAISGIINKALWVVDKVTHPLQATTQNLLQSIHIKKIEEHRHTGPNLFNRDYSVGDILHEKKINGDSVKSYPNMSNVISEIPATLSSLDNTNSTQKKDENEDVDFEQTEDHYENENDNSFDKNENENENENGNENDNENENENENENDNSFDKSENESNRKDKLSDTMKKTGSQILKDAHEKTNESVEKFKNYVPDKIKDHVPNQIKMPSSSAIEDEEDDDTMNESFAHKYEDEDFLYNRDE